MASSIPQARDGTLYLICGGDAGAFAQVRPLLEAMSGSLRWVGGPGTAAQVKALVNMLMNINTAGLAEALGLGAALRHRPRHADGRVRAHRRELARAGDRRRRHGRPRARRVFLGGARGEGFRHRARARRSVPAWACRSRRRRWRSTSAWSPRVTASSTSRRSPSSPSRAGRSDDRRSAARRPRERRDDHGRVLGRCGTGDLVRARARRIAPRVRPAGRSAGEHASRLRLRSARAR